MPPKKKSDLPPAPPAEENPEDKLPDDVRSLLDCPFSVNWFPVVSLLNTQSPDINQKALLETLKRRDAIKVVNLQDLALRLEPDAVLGQEVRASMETHLTSGNEFSTFAPSAVHATAMLSQRFDRDKRIDWKKEYVRRQASVQTVQQAYDEAVAALEEARLAVQEAEAKVQESKESRVEDEDAAGEEDAPALEQEPEDRELSPEEEQHAAAVTALTACDIKVKDLTKQLDAAQAELQQPYTRYQAYIVEALASEAGALIAAVEHGVPVRAVVWAHVDSSTITTATAAPAGSASAAATPRAVTPDSAAVQPGGSTSATPVPAVPSDPAEVVAPELWTAMAEAAMKAGWEGVAGGVATVKVAIPASPIIETNTEEEGKGKKGAAGKKDAKKKDEEPTPAAPVVDIPGWDIITSLLTGVCEKVKKYTEWKEKVKIYESAKAEEVPSMSYYSSLLDAVAPERCTVPVVMHAMLEQVSRNICGPDAVTELDQATAETDALAALSDAFSMLCGIEEEVPAPLDGNPVEPTHKNNSSNKPISSSYTVLVDGDDLSLTSAGLSVGSVRYHTGPHTSSHTGQRVHGVNRPESPTSPLDMQPGLESHTHSSTGGNSDADGQYNVSQRFHRADGTLDVDAVEKHMVSLIRVPGAERADIPDVPEIDDQAKSLRNTALKAQAGGIPLGTVQRYQLLTSFSGLLSDSSKVAHESDVMSRHHTRSTEAHISKQVVCRAMLELPHCAVGYDAMEDAAVVALYAGSYEKTLGPGLPVAINFAQFYARCAGSTQAPVQSGATVSTTEPDRATDAATAAADAAAEASPENDAKDCMVLPEKAYKMATELMTSAETPLTYRLQYDDMGHIIATGPGIPLSISKDSTFVTYTTAEASYGGADGPLLLLTTESGSGAIVSVYQSNRPPPPPPKPAGPTPEEIAAQKAAEEAAAAEAAALAAKPKSPAGKKAPPPAPAKKAAEVTSKPATPNPDEKPAEPVEAVPEPEPVAPVDPVLSIKVCLPDGSVVEMTTEGQVLVTPPEGVTSSPGYAPLQHRAVLVHGAPFLGGDLQQVTPSPLRFRAVTPNGGIVTAYEDGSISIMHPDGSVSERVAEVPGWFTLVEATTTTAAAAVTTTQPSSGVAAAVQPVSSGGVIATAAAIVDSGNAGIMATPVYQPASGWIRVLPDGTRFMEPDEGSVVPPPPPPPAPVVVQEPEEAKKGVKAPVKAKGKAKDEPEEEAPPPPPVEPPPPPPPFQATLTPFGSAARLDPDSRASVLLRQDRLLKVTYPDSSVMLQDGAGARLTKLPDGSWSLEYDGFPCITSTASGLSMRVGPGIMLEYVSACKVVTATLQDGSKVLVTGAVATYVPAALKDITPELLAFTMQGLSTTVGITPQTLADSPGLQGAAVYDLVTGAAWIRCRDVSFGGDPDHVQTYPVWAGISPGGPSPDHVVWPEAHPPLVTVSYPDPSTAAAGGATPRNGQKGDEDDQGMDEHDENADEDDPDAAQEDDPEVDEEGDDTENGVSRKGTAPPPQPIIKTRPVAAAIRPRLFIIYPSGTSCEILAPQIVQDIIAKAEADPHAVIETHPVSGSTEPGAVVRSFLRQIQIADLALPALPVGPTAAAQRYNPHFEDHMPAFKRLSTLQVAGPGSMNSTNTSAADASQAHTHSPGEPLSRGKYMPRILADYPPKVTPSKPLPVLLYTEVTELPEIDSEMGVAIQEAVSGVRVAEVVAEEGRNKAVPFTDVRPQEVQDADDDVLTQILALRQEAVDARRAAARTAVIQRQAQAEADSLAATQSAEAAEAINAAVIEKHKKPWPQKVGPFDGTPKRPSVHGPPIKYWETQEGIESQQEDPILRDGVQITRRTLPPRVCGVGVAPKSAAAPGTPSPQVPGVYFAQQHQLAPLDQDKHTQMGHNHHQGSNMHGAGQHAQQADDMHDSSTGLPHNASPTKTLAASAMFGSAKSGGAFTPTASQRVDYTYPELGHTSIMNRKSAGPNVRSPAYDVYGQPRTVQPPLPPIHRTEEAMYALNEQHLQAEGSVLRIPGGNTSAGQLLRATGKAAKQFSLTPGHIHFGNVALGATVHKTAKLRNVSTGHARFSVDRPEPPLKAIYKPGGIAAGMEALITIEFAPQQVGDFVGEVIVRSEINVFTLSVSAKVVEGDTMNGSAGSVQRSGGSSQALKLGGHGAAAGHELTSNIAELDPDLTLEELLARQQEKA